ncbi:MAG: hypothetical protein NWE92_13450 [Candidatus Bathyarchaeota archaeon]|nr:hypothetical protein [Candidatus Bathyarchaeota archaeon]
MASNKRQIIAAFLSVAILFSCILTATAQSTPTPDNSKLTTLAYVLIFGVIASIFVFAVTYMFMKAKLTALQPPKNSQG